MPWCVSSVGESKVRSCRIEGHAEELAGFARGLLAVGELPLSRCYCEVRLVKVQRRLSSRALRYPHSPRKAALYAHAVVLQTRARPGVCQLLCTKCSFKRAVQAGGARFVDGRVR